MIRWFRDEFTGARWESNPFQLFGTVTLGLWSVLQLVRGPTPGQAMDTQIDLSTQILVSSTNLFGALICLAGLHMRDLASALWVEVIGYVSLVGSLGIYLYLVAEKEGWINTAYGYGLVVAFCVGSAYRTVQIFAYKRAERRAERLRRLVDRVSPEEETDG